MGVLCVLKNNKGASLVIIIAIMALFMVLCMNILMSANVTSNNLGEEYDADRVNLYVSSVYRLLDKQVTAGELGEIFEGAGKTIDKANIVTFKGFIYQNKACDVEARAIKLGPAYGEIYYVITLDGHKYQVTGTYSLSTGANKTFIVSSGCSGIDETVAF